MICSRIQPDDLIHHLISRQGGIRSDRESLCTVNHRSQQIWLIYNLRRTHQAGAAHAPSTHCARASGCFSFLQCAALRRFSGAWGSAVRPTRRRARAEASAGLRDMSGFCRWPLALQCAPAALRSRTSQMECKRRACKHHKHNTSMIIFSYAMRSLAAGTAVQLCECMTISPHGSQAAVHVRACSPIHGQRTADLNIVCAHPQGTTVMSGAFPSK